MNDGGLRYFKMAQGNPWTFGDGNGLDIKPKRG